MDFTREPIIETVITPKEGYRLVVRSSKNMGQEEYFVDAVEVVSFGNAFFFRCLERPKPFVVPLGDYEVLEVREPRMVLKTPALEGSVKIGGGRELSARQQHREQREQQEKKEAPAIAEKEEQEASEGNRPAPAEMRNERRRDRRRSFRRRRGGAREEVQEAEEHRFPPAEGEERETLAPFKASPDSSMEGEVQEEDQVPQASPLLNSVLPPPTTLIRDDLARLRSNELYKGAFYVREDAEEGMADDEAHVESFMAPEESENAYTSGYDSYETSRNQQGASEVSPEDPFCVTEPSAVFSNGNEQGSQNSENDMESHS